MYQVSRCAPLPPPRSQLAKPGLIAGPGRLAGHGRPLAGARTTYGPRPPLCRCSARASVSPPRPPPAPRSSSLRSLTAPTLPLYPSRPAPAARAAAGRRAALISARQQVGRPPAGRPASRVPRCSPGLTTRLGPCHRRPERSRGPAAAAAAVAADAAGEAVAEAEVEAEAAEAVAAKGGGGGKCRKNPRPTARDPGRNQRPATCDPERPGPPGPVWVINALSLVTSIKFVMSCLCTLLLPYNAMLCHNFSLIS